MNPLSPATELAKERNRAAQERTLMAWIRTSLALISFGFGIDSIVSVLNQQLGGVLNPFHASRIIGMGFVALGTFAMLYAAMEHRRQIRNIERNELRYIPRISPTLIVAYVLAVLGGIAFVSILISPWLMK
jgi:putative membrane protein